MICVSNEYFISKLAGHDGNIPGASSGSTDLLPAPSGVFNWTATLVTDGGQDSDLTYRFDGRQAAKIPDWVVLQNLTHQFTITTWMKHGPSPGQRAEKETLLCNSDKTGETERELNEKRGDGGETCLKTSLWILPLKMRCSLSYLPDFP